MTATRLTFGPLILALAGSGCAPGLLWYGHDPSRTRRFELRANRGRQWLAETPRARHSGAFDALVVSDMVWSADGRRFCIAGQRGGRWYVVVDFEEGPAWDGVASLGFSADGRHVAYAAPSAGRWLVVHDGQPGPGFDALVEGTLKFSPDGLRFAYAAIDADCAHIVLNGQLLPCHEGVRFVVLGNVPEEDTFVVVDRGAAATLHGGSSRAMPGLKAFAADALRGRWAAAVQTGDAHVVIAQGEAVDQAPQVRDLLFSPDGRLAYAARRDGAWYFVLGGVVEGPYTEVGRPVFSANGARYGYVARTSDGQAAVIVDGAEQGRWPDADGLVFSPDSGRVAFAVRQEHGAAIVCGDHLRAFDVVVETAIGFSADGAHWAALVGSRSARRLSIVVDGEKYLPFDSEEFFGAQAQDAADPGHLREWVVAELEYHLRKGRR